LIFIEIIQLFTGIDDKISRVNKKRLAVILGLDPRIQRARFWIKSGMASTILL